MVIAIVALSILVVVEFTILYNLYRRSNELKKARKNKLIQKELDKQTLIRYFIDRVNKADTLNDIYILHIQIWANGIQHPNFGPDKYGMFRTKNILTMTKDEVFLGNINGRFTKELSFWETQENKEDILQQYKNILLFNMVTMLS